MEALVRYAGILVGLVLAGGLGSSVAFLARGSTGGLLGILLGVSMAYFVVKALARYPSLRPPLRWLFPYRSWSGERTPPPTR